ncbi:transcriptional regulator [Streptomyces longispororuber]|uniref:Transcriptional regulator n=1 Tax=Streptomyces longispororuber TaxID=68230 RepID=A0A919ADN3_9ACTN|nr:GAF and ANTAR domain-containing protein [Streptomyces longispororuber]GHF00576.1 transcriptional regulator [Streptomyces longispororuber]
MSREEEIARTFVELADTLIQDFDVIDFLHQLTARCREIFALTDAAVLLAYPEPEHMYSPAPCDPSPALARVLDVALREGPALEAYRTAAPVAPGELVHAPADWERFTARAREAGYTYAAAVPMRLRQQSLGALLLLSSNGTPLPAQDLSTAQAFADAATIGLIHARTLQHAGTVNQQLHTALHSRILIEQAKGYLSAQRGISLNDAFTALRGHARHHRVLLTTTAQHVLTTGSLTAAPPAGRPPTDTSSTE